MIFLFQVFIDELDAIAPARKDGGEELSQRMIATLLNLMDGISRTDRVLVIAASNRPDSIEPALRRPGRLDREIEIGSVRVLFFAIHSFASLTFPGVLFIRSARFKIEKENFSLTKFLASEICFQ